MKRIFGILLCLMLVIQVPSFSADADTQIDITKEQYILNRLGIIPSDSSSNFDAPVSRAAFVGYVFNAVKLSPVADKLYFSDVPSDYWASKQINAAVEMGFIHGNETGRFEPENSIKYTDACKILVLASGYGTYAGSLGDTPEVYTAVAKKVGMDISPDNTEALTLAEVIKLVYNAVTVYVPNITGVKNSEIVSSVKDKQTLLSMYHSVYINEGRLEAVYGKNLYENEAADGYAIIDGTKFKIDSEYSADELFGIYVEYFYIDSNDSKTLIYAEDSGYDKITESSAELVSGFDVGTYTLRIYTDNNYSKEKKVSIDRGARVIVNGRPSDNKLSDKFSDMSKGFAKGNVTVISPRDDTDIIIINSTRTFTVGAYDPTEEILYNKYDMSDKINLKDYTVKRITDYRGFDCDMPEELPFVLTIAASDDGYSIDISVCGEYKNAAFESVKSNKQEVSVDGETHKIDKLMLEKILPFVKTGNMYKIVFDKYGDIVYVGNLEGGMQFGYLRMATGDDSVFERKYSLDMYMPDGKFHSYPLAKTVRIDGKAYKVSNAEELFSAFPGNAEFSGRFVILPRQVIRFITNASNEVTDIDTYNVNTAYGETVDNSLTRRRDGSKELTYVYSQKRFGLGDIYSTTSTALFVVPKVNSSGEIIIDNSKLGDTENRYSTKYAFGNDKRYAVETYYVNDISFCAAAMVLIQEPRVEGEQVFMFDSLSRGLNTDEEECYVLNGISKGTEVQYFVDDMAAADVYSLKTGDLVRLDTDNGGTTALRIYKMYDSETKTFNNGVAGEENFWYANPNNFNADGGWYWRDSKYQLTKSYAYDVKGTFVRSAYKISDLRQDVFDECVNASGISINVFDSKKDRNQIYAGSLGDIIGYVSSGDKCSVIITNNNATTVEQIFVYK